MVVPWRHTRALLALALLAGCAHVRPPLAARATSCAAPRAAAPAGTVRVPLAERSHHVWLRAVVEGHRGAFVLDTGAAVTVLDRAFASRCGIASEGRERFRGLVGRVDGDVAQVDHLVVGGAELGDVEVAVLDLAPLAGSLGGRPDGLLGWDALSRYRVTLDPARQLLVLASPSDLPGNGTMLPLRTFAGVPLVTARVAGAARPFVLDSGDGFALEIDPTLAGGARSGTRVASAGVGGRCTMSTVILDHVALGPTRLTDVEAALWAPPAGGPAGVIGWPVMARFVCTFDAPHGRLWLAARGRAGDDDALVMSERR